jgi:hypothetical protein
VEGRPGRVSHPRVTWHVLATTVIPGSASVTDGLSSPRTGRELAFQPTVYASLMRTPRAGLPRVGRFPALLLQVLEGGTQRRSLPAATARTQDSHDRGLQPIRRPIHSQPRVSRTMTARWHSLHQGRPDVVLSDPSRRSSSATLSSSRRYRSS